VAASVRAAPEGRWACNAGDPSDLSYGALARLVAEQLGWEWETRTVAWDQGDHPWNVRHPVVADTGRLRDVLGVTEPDPLTATAQQVGWLWDRREDVAQL
jgi:nucleoside-diphosphate-sugar epimerase